MRSSEVGGGSAFAEVALPFFPFAACALAPLEELLSASSAFLSLARLAATSAPSSSFAGALDDGVAFLAIVFLGAVFSASSDSMGRPMLLSRLAFTPSLL